MSVVGQLESLEGFAALLGVGTRTVILKKE